MYDELFDHPEILQLRHDAMLALLKDIDEALAAWELSGFLQYGKTSSHNDKWLERIEQDLQNAICEIDTDYLLEL
jgi:hypothetical protein